MPWSVVTTVVAQGLPHKVPSLSTLPGNGTIITLAPGHPQGKGKHGGVSGVPEPMCRRVVC